MQGMKNRTQSELLGKSKPYGIQTKNSYLVFIEISNNHSDKKGQSNHATQEYKNMNIDSMHLYKWQKKKNTVIHQSQWKQLWSSSKDSSACLPAPHDE